jgi:hypothetical protein
MTNPENPQEVMAAWKEQQLEGILAPDAEPGAGKQYRRLELAGDIIGKNVTVGGGTVEFLNGALVEVDKQGNPVNELLRQALKEFDAEMSLMELEQAA